MVRIPLPKRVTRPAERVVCAAVFVLLFVCLNTPRAQAHSRSISYSSWEIKDRRARVTLRLTALDVSRFPWMVTAGPDADRVLGEHVAARLRLLAGGTPCPLGSEPRRLVAAPGNVVFEWQLSCPEKGDLVIRSDLLYEVAPSHLHIARVRLDGPVVLERLFSSATRDWALAITGGPGGQQPRGSSLFDYVKVGIDHILSGPDHLAFILALLLLGASFSEVAKVVTGFTVAHSITLALTVLGYLQPNRAAINALIGLSIAMVAVENVWLGSGRGRLIPVMVGGGLALQALAAGFGSGCVPALTLAGLAVFSVCYFGLLARVPNAASLRWAIAFLFGLMHGFGFAGVLLEAQLSDERLVKALFGFNVGVEVGQFALVALVWPPLRRAACLEDRRLHAVLLETGSAAVLAIGMFWFVTRTYGFG